MQTNVINDVIENVTDSIIQNRRTDGNLVEQQTVDASMEESISKVNLKEKCGATSSILRMVFDNCDPENKPENHHPGCDSGNSFTIDKQTTLSTFSDLTQPSEQSEMCSNIAERKENCDAIKQIEKLSKMTSCADQKQSKLAPNVEK